MTSRILVIHIVRKIAIIIRYRHFWHRLLALPFQSRIKHVIVVLWSGGLRREVLTRLGFGGCRASLGRRLGRRLRLSTRS